MKKWIARFSIALNLLIVVLALGAWFNRDVFISAFVEQLYIARVSFFDSYPLEAGDVVMLGDSITHGGEWTEIFPAHNVKNRGIGGDTTAGVLKRLDPIVASKPAAIFLKIGTNDLTHGPERDVSYQQYRGILNTIQSESPATDIYVQSVLPRKAEFREEVEAYNREIREMANELDITYINLYPSFLAPDGSIRDELTYDEIHLTGQGYQLWQSLLTPAMSGYRIQQP
jgi:lysophospholipase L1-like esterase|tara:strand:+ start:30733 stop:31416 length:684 start_codon:yes stop_codon:yes gene_type:complete